MGHSITEAEATSIAELFLANNDNKGWSFSLLGAHPDRIEKGNWAVVFQTISPSGAACDGPMVVKVNGQTRTAEFL